MAGLRQLILALVVLTRLQVLSSYLQISKYVARVLRPLIDSQGLVMGAAIFIVVLVLRARVFGEQRRM
jgi:hypothetical protein